MQPWRYMLVIGGSFTDQEATDYKLTPGTGEGNQTMNEKRLMRSTSERMIAGVAGGLASYLNMDVTLVRLILVLLALAGGPGVLIYIILWVVMPEDGI